MKKVLFFALLTHVLSAYSAEERSFELLVRGGEKILIYPFFVSESTVLHDLMEDGIFEYTADEYSKKEGENIKQLLETSYYAHAKSYPYSRSSICRVYKQDREFIYKIAEHFGMEYVLAQIERVGQPAQQDVCVKPAQ